MPITEMGPHIRLICDDCGEEPGNEEFGGWFCFPADDIENALSESCFHRIGNEIICDNCAYNRLHTDDGSPSSPNSVPPGGAPLSAQTEGARE